MRKLILLIVAFGIAYSVHSQVVYVTTEGSGLKDGTSWSNALDGNTAALTGYTKLAEAIKAASSGSVFWIAEGTYKACTDYDREKSFELGQNIKLYGGFEGTETDTLTRNISLHPTIFNGDIGIQKDSTDNTKIILKTAPAEWSVYSFVDGINFIGAYNDDSSAQGAGIQNYGYLSLMNCTLRNNHSSNYGGGISNGNIIRIERCLFFNNKAVWGGGILNHGFADIRSSKFIGNNAGYGGGISTIAGANLTLINSLVVNNASWNGDGGGISTFSPFGGTTSKIINSTISNNSGLNVLLWMANIKVFNSIIWGGGGVADWYNSSVEYKNSILQGDIGNPTIYDADPKFICPTRGAGLLFNGLDANWGILGDSPAIDKGDDGLIPEGVLTDFAGNPRIHFSSVDIGAFERQSPMVVGEACLNGQGVNIEIFNNAQPSLELAPTGSASGIVPINSLGSDEEGGVSDNPYRIRGYLLPTETGYYKFFLAAYSGSSFYLSTDSMEYHKKLAISGCCTAYLPWPLNVNGTYKPNLTYFVDSVLLNKDQQYYFEILGALSQGTSGKSGIRWTLPGSNIFSAIPSENLKQALPRYIRSSVEYIVFKDQETFDFNLIRNTDPVPSQSQIIDSLKKEDQLNTLDHFTSRIRGYIIPTISGKYNFYFSADDAGQFWLSSDTSTANAQLKSDIASPQTDWKKNISSQTLIAEQKYYFEILQHDNLGSDGLKLGWAVEGDTVPEVISKTFLINYIDGLLPKMVKFGKEQILLQKGRSLIPGYMVYPWNASNRKVVMTSSDPSIASVDNNGMVTGLRPGSCRIIIKSVSDPTLTDTTTIIVNQIEKELFNYRLSEDFNILKNSSEIPDETIDIDELKISSSLDFDSFSTRVRGYLVPPVTGNYEFYFAADDFGQFWLSADTSQEDALLRSDITSFQSDWTQNISSQELVAGHKYYFEVLHHEIDAYDLIKLGWKIPGTDSAEVIKTPYMIGCGDNIRIKSILFADNRVTGYPGWTISTKYQIAPWNATNRGIYWRSSNNNIATVDDDGKITIVSQGNCLVIASSKDNALVSDTIFVTGTNPSRSWFVKQNAPDSGTGLSWDDPIDLARVLDLLNLYDHTDVINVFVAEGIYKPTHTINRGKTFTLNNVRLVGGFDASVSGTDTITRDWNANETILSGEIGNPDDPLDNSYHVIVMRGSTRSVADGITIRDGMASTEGGFTRGGFSYVQRDNYAGGILIESSPSSRSLISNCKIINNTARSGGGGLSSYSWYGYERTILINNSYFIGNKTKGRLLPVDPDAEGIVFQLFLAANGSGIWTRCSLLKITDCIFRNNYTAGYGALYSDQTSVTDIERTTIYNNTARHENAIYAKDGGIFNIKNSTIKGEIAGFYHTSFNLLSTTVVGTFDATNSSDPTTLNHQKYKFDNTIITGGFSITNPSDTSIYAQHSILVNRLYGADKTEIISSSVPDYTNWLDTLNWNGGPTRTMKLKRVAGNPAIGNGNPEYLGTTDQRGALRTGSVSIGAYQDVNTTGMSISPQQVTICSGESALFNASVLPAFAPDSTYTVTSSDNNIAYIDGNKIYGVVPGNADIIVSSTDGGFRDTCRVVVTGPVTSHFVPVWIPCKGIEEMTLIALTATIDNVNLQPGDEIGVFDGDLCVGVGVITQVPGGSNNLEIKVSRDDPGTLAKEGYSTGDTITYRVLDISSSKEISRVQAAYITGLGVFSAGSRASFNLFASTDIVQDINLSGGWNILSFAVKPSDMSMMTVINPMISAGTLLKVQDEKGNAIEKLPAPIGWVNNIGQMSVTEGYKIKVSTGASLEIIGKPVVLPYTIPLSAGWNIMGYPLLTSQTALTVFDPLVTAGTLLKVQDEKGNAIEKLPVLGWIDNVNNLSGGKGYKVKTSVNTTLIISAPGKGEYYSEEMLKTSPIHFKTSWSGNGLDHMNIYITKPTLGGEGLKAGDEIGVFDGNVCVGAVVIEDPESGCIMAAASLDDAETQERDGYTPGGKLELMLWDCRSGIERSIKETQYAKGYTNLFEKNGTTMLKPDFQREGKTVLGDAYPNPSADRTTFTFETESESDVRLEIYNIRGDLVKILVNGSLKGGVHAIEWNNRTGSGEKTGAGIYFYRLKLNNIIATKQLVVY